MSIFKKRLNGFVDIKSEWSKFPCSTTNFLSTLQCWYYWARSIQPKFPEISVQHSMDRFGPTGKVSKKRVHLLRWTTFPGRTSWNFGWMDRAHYHYHYYLFQQLLIISWIKYWFKKTSQSFHLQLSFKF